MQSTDQPVTESQSVEQQKMHRRAALLRELNIEAKTDVEKATARLDRVQLFLFLTECMENLLVNKVLLSRPSPQRFWCQTGFYVEDSTVYAKFGEALMQPIGWLTDTEFWMTSASKFLWKHEFCFADHAAGATAAPYKVTVNEKEEDSKDTGGLTEGERKALEAIAKDIAGVLDLKKPEAWVRDAKFVPKKGKAKWGPGELIEKVRAWLTEHEEELSARALAVATEGVAKGVFDEAYAVAATEAAANKTTIPAIGLWAAGMEASKLAETESSAFAAALAAETVPHTEEELDALAWQAEHRDRAVETLKYWAMNSRLFDDRLRKLHDANPELNANYDNADILGLLASAVVWANTSLTDDRISRVIRSTTVVAGVTPETIAQAEATMALRLTPMVEGALKGLGKDIEEIPDNDPRLLRAMGVISQARVALPVIQTRLKEMDDATLDVALREIQKLLQATIDKAHVGACIGNPDCVAKVQISTEPAKG